MGLLLATSPLLSVRQLETSDAGLIQSQDWWWFRLAFSGLLLVNAGRTHAPTCSDNLSMVGDGLRHGYLCWMLITS